MGDYVKEKVVVPGPSDDELKRAIDAWNDPHSLFMSSIVTIMGHTRNTWGCYSNEVTPCRIDRFTMEDFAGVTEEEKARFVRCVNDELDAIKAGAEAIAEHIDKRIVERIAKEGPWVPVKNGKRGVWHGRKC